MPKRSTRSKGVVIIAETTGARYAITPDFTTRHHREGETNMDQGVRGWIYKTARQNMWRVSNHIDLADLMQDGFLVWHRVCIKYPNVQEQKHRMALFKTAFTNHIHDLSKKRSRLDLVTEADLDTPMDVMLEGEDPTSDPDLAFIVKQLPPALLRVLKRVIESNGPYRLNLDHTRETTNERLCRFAGLDPSKRNIQAALLQYLAGVRLHPQYD